MLNPPFTIKQFLGVFAAYNQAIWPAQPIAYALGFIAIGALWFNSVQSKRLIPIILAMMWAWTGIGYHFLFFSPINPLATIFAAAFVLQSIGFASVAITNSDFRFDFRQNVRSAASIGCIVYAMLIYPIFGSNAGHGLMEGPAFGLTPCPTTIFTIGILLAARGKSVAWLAIIPVLWSLVGLAAAIQLSIPEDFGLPVAALVLVIAIAIGKPVALRSHIQTAQD